MLSRRSTSMLAAISLLIALSGTRAKASEWGEVTAHLGVRTAKEQHGHAPPAVLWLEPLQGEDHTVTVAPHGKFVLQQKNKMFSPHLLIVPVGSVVFFPNKDPFFHNVFSLFDGKRFDLGLYEAGSTREVTFSREGISYIFCNIHPEMSAVVVALSTPFYGIANANGGFHLKNVPSGEYELHLWVEGEQQPLLDRFTKRIRVSSEGADLGEIQLDAEPRSTDKHLNKFGQPYHPDDTPTY